MLTLIFGCAFVSAVGTIFLAWGVVLLEARLRELERTLHPRRRKA